MGIHPGVELLMVLFHFVPKETNEAEDAGEAAYAGQVFPEGGEEAAGVVPPIVEDDGGVFRQLFRLEVFGAGSKEQCKSEGDQEYDDQPTDAVFRHGGTLHFVLGQYSSVVGKCTFSKMFLLCPSNYMKIFHGQ